MLGSVSRASRIAFRIAALTTVCGCLLGASGCGRPRVVVAPITITTNDINGMPVTTTTLVTRIDDAGVCNYRLEFKDPGDPRGISEVSGNRGPAQRIDSCAAPPAFTATAAANAPWFEEQSAYFWAKKARDYAQASLWITPPGWEGAAPKLAVDEVGVNVLTRGGDARAFEQACWPRDPDGCMRFWPGQNPKVFIPAGRAFAHVVGHEYGHYAAGYVFGHMDTSAPNGFDIGRCIHRSFQEGIAETFYKLLEHHELNAAGPAATPSGVAMLSSPWINECTIDEYLISAPLWEAFTQSVWGTGLDESGAPVTVPWPNPDAANLGMANAFTYALATIRDFRIHRFAQAALDHVEKNQPATIAAPVRAIFAAHGLTLSANGKHCVENSECTSTYCDSGDGTSRTQLCMPAARSGADKDLCTHDAQCESNNCASLRLDHEGRWIPGRCAPAGSYGQACANNGQCASGYCDRGYNTANTGLCLPKGGAGAAGDACSHDRQCASNHCADLELDDAGRWQAGRCSGKAGLGQFCAANADCDSNDCDVGTGSTDTAMCTPANRAGRLNDTCTQHAQCASGLCAELRTGANGIVIAGRCATSNGLGKACSGNSDCASGYCDRGNNTGHTNLCLPSPQTGQPGDLCSSDRQCIAGKCANLTQTADGNRVPGHCVLPVDLGTSCSSNAQCRSGYCDAGIGTAQTNRCMPPANRGTVGEICSNDNQCATGNCSGLSRNSAGEWLPGQCAAKLGIGQRCSSNHYCQSGFCDAGPGTAQTLRCMPAPGTGANGQPCSNDNQCATGNCAGLRTDNYNNWIPGQCAAKNALGDPCTGNSQCGSSYCDVGWNTANTYRCMPRGRAGIAGNPCTHDTQCASGNCNNLMRDASGNWVPGNCL